MTNNHWLDSKEYEELKAKFSVGLQEDVTNWDSFETLLFTVYEKGFEAGQQDQ